MIAGLVVAGLLAAAGWWAWPKLRRRGLDRWLPAVIIGGLLGLCRRRPRPTHLFVALVDHFEPSRGRAPAEVAEARLRRWIEGYPKLAERHRDADGRPPRHTFCYPIDEWRDGEIAALTRLVHDGYADIELHLHHDGDTSDGLRATLADALERFGRHGALHAAGDPVRPAFAFVHGNWCLDNSRPDGRWCGVNDEIRILAEAGCIADFTYPAPDGSQPRTANVVYSVTDDPTRPRSHDRGVPLTVGRPVTGDLVLIPGPLGINARDWHHRFYPAVEQAELAAHVPVTARRVDFWIRCGVGVRGRPEWVFCKLHCHGCQERDQDALLGDARHAMLDLLEARYNDGRRHVLHYVTAREMLNLARAAADGFEGEPAAAFDYAVAPAPCRFVAASGPYRAHVLTAEHGDLENLSDGACRWELRLGPVVAIEGRFRRLTWRGEEVTVDGEANVTRRGAAP